MINLLLPTDKKIISTEYRSRVIISLGIAIGLLLFFLAVGLVSFYVALNINNNSLTEALKIENLGGEIKEFDYYSSQMVKANKMIKTLTMERSSLHIPSEIFDRIMVAKPVGIKLKNIDIGKVESSDWKLTLSGMSRQRNDLLNFINNLKKDPLFASVDSPFANLIKGGESDFSIVITLVDLQKNVTP